MPRDWYKRRAGKPNKVVNVVCVPDFKKEHNHFCKMEVLYMDESTETLRARVIYNPLTDNWTVDGMHVAVRLVE